VGLKGFSKKRGKRERSTEKEKTTYLTLRKEREGSRIGLAKEKKRRVWDWGGGGEIKTDK